MADVSYDNNLMLQKLRGLYEYVNYPAQLHATFLPRLHFHLRKKYDISIQKFQAAYFVVWRYPCCQYHLESPFLVPISLCQRYCHSYRLNHLARLKDECYNSGGTLSRQSSIAICTTRLSWTGQSPLTAHNEENRSITDDSTLANQLHCLTVAMVAACPTDIMPGGHGAQQPLVVEPPQVRHDVLLFCSYCKKNYPDALYLKM